MPSKKDRTSLQPHKPDQTPKTTTDQMVRFTEENEEESEAKSITKNAQNRKES